MNFVPIAVAFDSGGKDAVEQWIKAANPTYPCLIDRRHLVAELYGMVNVPTAVWIDERGHVVRPAEPAGTSDAFRRMDRKKLVFPPDVLEENAARRNAYLNALRDWAMHGAASRYALADAEVLRRTHLPSDDHARAAASFRIGEYLYESGHPKAAYQHFMEACRLRPESWNYRRQLWSLEDPAKATGAEFWAAVDELGDARYYPDIEDI